MPPAPASALSNTISDNYDDGFDDDDIEEDLPESDIEIETTAKKEKFFDSQGQSQSMGVDPSVDSLALESYDHVEPVDRGLI